MKKYNYLAEEFLKLHTFKPVWAEFILVSGAKPNGKNIGTELTKHMLVLSINISTLQGPVNISTPTWSQIWI